MKTRIIILCLLLLQIFQFSNSRAVIGIDFGTEWIKIGLVKPGAPIDVVLNEQSKRKTENYIGFLDKDRFFGYNANQKITRFPTEMAKFLNLNFEKFFQDGEFEKYKQLYIPINFVKNEQRGTISVKLKSGKIYSVEVLLAMMLRLVKNLAKVYTDSNVTECTISIPPFWTVAQRRAMIKIGKLAGLDVLSLIHEGTAVALQYGLTKLRKMKEPRNVLFYDFGASSLKVSIARFTPPSGKTASEILGVLKVKAVTWDKNVGGIDFETVLANYFADVYKKEKGQDLTNDPRAMSKFMQSAAKVKEILSANTETIAYVEGLVDDTDFKYLITRETFLKLSKPIFDKLVDPVKQALKDANLTIDKIHSFEVLGGGSRVPEIQNILSKEFGKLKFSLNADESIALGSAFFSASLSPMFRVRNFKITEVYPFEIKVNLSRKSTQSTSQEFTLFPRLDWMDASKTVTIPRDEDFSFTITEGGVGSLVTYHVKGVKEVLEGFKPSNGSIVESGKKSVKLTFDLDKNGIVSLKSARADFEESFKKIVKVKVKVEDEKKDEKKEEKKDEKKEEEKKDGKKDEKPKTKIVSKEKIITKSQTKILNVEHEDHGLLSLTDEILKQYEKEMSELDEYEKLKLITVEKRNNLESLIYSTKSGMSDLSKYSTEDEKKNYEKVSTEIDDWLNFGDGEDSTADEYQKKYDLLQSVYQPVQQRFDQTNERPKVLTGCRDIFNQSNQFLDLFKKMGTNHIKQDLIDGLESKTKEVTEWLDKTVSAIEKAPLFETPVVTNKEIKEKCDKLREQLLVLIRMPPPPPKSNDDGKNGTKIEVNESNKTSNEEKKDEKKEEKKDEKINEENQEKKRDEL